MKSIYKISFLFILTLLFTQCRKDSIEKTAGTTTLTPSENVDMLIQVIDEGYNPISDATIRLKGHSDVQYTDDNGVTMYQGLSVPSIGLLATITHPDYTKQYKMINGSSNTNGVTKVMMIKDLFESTIQAGESGFIDDRGFLTLPEILMDEKGNEYSGAIKVLSHYFDPDEDDFLTQAPGSMLAENEEDKIVVLGSYGMYLIELFDASSNTPVNIRDGEKAIIKFPIAEKHQGMVTDDIPLWSFDEDQGIWIEEGSATLEGDFMVAEVGHFSFWNCDLPYEFVNVKMTFIDKDDNLLVQERMTFFIEGAIQFGEDITNSEGVINGKLPLNTEVNVELHLITGEKVTTTIGPITNGDDMTVTFDYTVPAKISGRALQCMGSNVEEGYVIVHIPAINFTGTMVLNADGTFAVSTIAEDQELTFVDIQNDRLKKIEVTKTELESSPVMLGDVMLCDESESTEISGYVYLDENEDGVDDSPVENVVVTIVNGPSGETVAVTTDVDGHYNASILPGVYFISIDVPNGYKIQGVGDLSPDDAGDTGAYQMGTEITATLNALEQDSDNNFQLVEQGVGTISGNVMIDFDEDGIPDKAPSQLKIIAQTDQRSFETTTDINGDYSFDNIPNDSFSIYVSREVFVLKSILDFDTTPDPDGDDSDLGPNKEIPVRLEKDEIDSDNNFLKGMTQSVVSCRVMIDTDNDGIGDTPFEGQRVELYKRSDVGTPVAPLLNAGNSDENGNITFDQISSGEYVLYFIGSGNILNYDNLGGEDLIIDNNPMNTSGEKSFLPVDIIGLEYDDGNTFTFRKN